MDWLRDCETVKPGKTSLFERTEKHMFKDKLKQVKSGLYGVCAADAVGVPVEFQSRETLRVNPVKDMTGNGTYNQPAGTWSDDSSLTLALADSIAKTKGIHTHDIMDRFIDWYRNGAYSPWGECFDIGNTTVEALRRYETGTEPVLCGGNSASSNGNGSLMRILPMAYILHARYGAVLTAYSKPMELIHKVSGLTHRHPVAQSACGIYVNIAARLLDGMPPETAIENGVLESLEWYQSHDAFIKAAENWKRLRDVTQFRMTPEEAVKSSGYVVYTLEAALWCLLNTGNYRDCVLAAVNLGSDTDTTAAVAGGLAGLAYGLDGIPASWLESLAGKELIDECCKGFAKYVDTLQTDERNK